MDAVEYLKTLDRMCHCECLKCEFGKARRGFETCPVWQRTHPEEAVEVLSMYDGMSCGHIALDKLGAEITAYYATEIDKYAIQTTQHNYPDTVQLGDAFQVRNDDWGK